MAEFQPLGTVKVAKDSHGRHVTASMVEFRLHYDSSEASFGGNNQTNSGNSQANGGNSQIKGLTKILQKTFLVEKSSDGTALFS